MTKRPRNIGIFCILALLTVNSPVWSSQIASNVSAKSIDGAGRNIMRTSDGGIVAAFSTNKSGLVFARSSDNGVNWNNVPIENVHGAVLQAAIDSNFQGSYIAFTEELNGHVVGRIAFASAPFGVDPRLSISLPVTPERASPQDTFIQASRAGWGNLAADNRKTVVYGWQDSVSKGLYIGVSPDGINFPMAKLVVKDEFATSGPAVAIRGNYVVATYQTANPAIAPADVPMDIRKGHTYPAWVESLDGGRTWSEPRPLFGLTADAFPMVSVEATRGIFAKYRLAGGSALPNSPILNWASSRELEGGSFEVDKTVPEEPQRNREGSEQVSKPSFARSLGGTTFVETSMRGIDGNLSKGEVSIVSFRPIEPGAKWTHVVANNALTGDSAHVDGVTSALGAQESQFQYSALIDTPVRATTYQEIDPRTGRARLVAAVSTDTGKSFKEHKSFSVEDLTAYGITDFGKGTVFAVSQCLFEDRNGEVHVDVLVANDGEARFASIPIGVNAAKLRAQERAQLTSR